MEVNPINIFILFSYKLIVNKPPYTRIDAALILILRKLTNFIYI